MIDYKDREYKLPASLIPYYEKLCDIVFINLYLRKVKKEIQILNPCLYAPSGVGKTEIATYLAKFFYADIVLNRIKKLVEVQDKELADSLIKQLYKDESSIPEDLKKPENLTVIRLLLQTYLPDEILGVPRAVKVEITTGNEVYITNWTVPEWEQKLKIASEKRPVILFLDELDKPTSDAVSAVLSLLSNRTIRDREIPDNIVIVGAMQNVSLEPSDLIENRTVEALFRRLFFIPIKDIPIHISTIENFDVSISKSEMGEDELYQITQFGRKFQEKFGELYKLDPIYPPGKSPREIAYLGNFIQALAKFKFIPTPDMIEKHNKEVRDDEEKITIENLEKEEIMKKLFYLKYEGSKSLKDYFEFIEYNNYIKVAIALYKTFILGIGKKEGAGDDFKTFAKIEKEEAYLNSIKNLYTTLFSNDPLTFTRYLSYAIITTPYEIVKSEVYQSNLNLYSFYTNNKSTFDKVSPGNILIYPTLYGFVNANRKRFEKILGKYKNIIDLEFKKKLNEFPNFYILELFFFIFLTNIILISSALIYLYITEYNNKEKINELQNKLKDFVFQIKLLLGEDIANRLLYGTETSVSYYISAEYEDDPDKIRDIFFNNLFKFTDINYINQVKEEKNKFSFEMVEAKGNVSISTIRNILETNGNEYEKQGGLYTKKLDVVKGNILEKLEKTNDNFIATSLAIYLNSFPLLESVYKEVNDEKYNVLLEKQQ
jgi:hypothetical protein